MFCNVPVHGVMSLSTPHLRQEPGSPVTKKPLSFMKNNAFLLTLQVDPVSWNANGAGLLGALLVSLGEPMFSKIQKSTPILATLGAVSTTAHPNEEGCIWRIHIILPSFTVSHSKPQEEEPQSKSSPAPRKGGLGISNRASRWRGHMAGKKPR